ncbi:MAG: zinc metallopeptidase [Verrucomicrobiales bacterium]|nr:zinc metallopeptidase [Verrucomicrobiales bacterium]
MTLFWLLFLGTMALSLLAAAGVKRSYRKWSEVPAALGRTGAEVAHSILHREGIHDVEVVPHDGMLSDHYDPIHKRLALSKENYYGTSVAALGVSAHEAGHAIQHARSYGWLHLRMTAVGLTEFASSWLLFLPMIGAAFALIPWSAAAMLMGIGWGVMMLFNLITLPVEFDASARAKRILARDGYITGREIDGVSSVLNAAAWTYVAAFITSLGYMLFHLAPFLTGQEE